MVGSRPELSPGTIAVADRREAITGTSQRLVSLDIFRGMTIAAMMLVNNAGGFPEVYSPLKHAFWHGWTFTDTVFPFFLWICGVAMTLSFAKRVEAGADRSRLLLHSLRRGAMIFGLGLLLNGFPYYNLATIRIPGVLQRIGLCYAIGALIFLYTSPRVQAWITAACLMVYWALMSWVPVPGCGAGSLERECNLEQYIDGMFLSGHMYSATKTWDPEGIVSTIPAVATILFGILTGYLLRSALPALEKLGWMFFTGNLLLFVGLFWDKALPINKNIWTSSYTVFMAGMALVVFACCFWLADYKGWKKWGRPFEIYGSNAIAVYVMAGLIARLIGMAGLRKPISEALLSFAAPAHASLLYGMMHVTLLYLIAWALYKKGWFLKI
ncbi:MAG: DUF5009 domain-containing protein [Acidobacteria bacterium]|nr:DUF5009 domain-containing protein [Acidobacteriota bacterium]